MANWHSISSKFPEHGALVNVKYLAYDNTTRKVKAIFSAFSQETQELISEYNKIDGSEKPNYKLAILASSSFEKVKDRVEIESVMEWAYID